MKKLSFFHTPFLFLYFIHDDNLFTKHAFYRLFITSSKEITDLPFNDLH